LGDLGVSTDVPVTAEEWREAHRTTALNKDEPPEVQVAAEDKSQKVTTTADVWMLGVMLATTALGAHPFSSPWHPPLCFSDDVRIKDKKLFRPPANLLLDPLRARLCLLLQWMLAYKPEDRLEIGETAALMGALPFTSAEELLTDMPEQVRIAFEDIIVDAANQLSKEQTPGWALARLQVALTTKVIRTTTVAAPNSRARDHGEGDMEPSKETNALDDGAASEGSTEESDTRSYDDHSSDTESDRCNKSKPLSQADSDEFFSNPFEEPYSNAKAGCFDGNPFAEESPF